MSITLTGTIDPNAIGSVTNTVTVAPPIGGAVTWNFQKYLIGRDGYIADVFPSAVEPTDTRIKTGIARALADT